MTIDKDHPHEVVKKQYEELMENGMPFLQIFPEMIQELTVAETFKNRTKARNKSITQSHWMIKVPVSKNLGKTYFYIVG